MNNMFLTFCLVIAAHVVTVAATWAETNKFIEANQVEGIIVEGKLIDSFPLPKDNGKVLLIGYNNTLYHCIVSVSMASCLRPELLNSLEIIQFVSKPHLSSTDIASDIIPKKSASEPLPEDIARDIIAAVRANNIITADRSDCPVEEELEEGEEMPEECMGPEEKVSKEVPSEELFETMYYEFPNTLTTNLKGSRRFLQVGIGISTQYDETVIENVEAYMPALIAEILATLSDYTEEEVAGREARFALAEDLRTTMNTALTLLEGFGGIEKVHITSFVIH
jgi:flagellar protein FliL